ncbi:MAG: hypothetical protein JJE09_14185 [Bacteroidia bacterium]|nr:hypothetical protein [Bacteroidia bacterium]
MFKNYASISALLAIGCGIFFNSCDNQKDVQDDSTFGLIQSKIFTPSCAISGCHSSESDNTFLQHQLVLESKVSYANLVDIAPQNANALVDKLIRVKPFHAEESLLYHKLHLASHHESDYGNPMPLGLELLSEGQLEFVRRWIEAGAPETGTVVDITLLDDTTPQPEDFEPLLPPEAGNGLQIVLSEFNVAPNFEREFFVYQKLGNQEEIFVNRFEIKMRQNSHHFILYDFEGIPDLLRPAVDLVRDIRNPDGSLNIGNLIPMGYHVFVIGTQTPYLEYDFPEGVALSFPANAVADLNSHYVNKQSKEIVGEVYINLHTLAAGEVKKVAKTLNLGNQNLNLAAKQRVTLTKSFKFDKSISIISLTSHTHKLGEKFVIKINGGPRNGEIVYSSSDWHHPDFITISPPITLDPGEGLTSEITYNNTNDKAVKFGLTSEDEMGIIFGYYYEN